jgi:hypothetical protein
MPIANRISINGILPDKIELVDEDKSLTVVLARIIFSIYARAT